MLEKCVSLGNAGQPNVTWMPASANPHDFGEAEADMWGGLTSDGLFNTSYFASDQTSTPWVRLFAETDSSSYHPRFHAHGYRRTAVTRPRRRIQSSSAASIRTSRRPSTPGSAWC